MESIARPQHGHSGPDWLDQGRPAPTAQSGGILRRKVRDVERAIGRGALELAVRQRGYHMIECEGEFLIICKRAPVRVIC